MKAKTKRQKAREAAIVPIEKVGTPLPNELRPVTTVEVEQAVTIDRDGTEFPSLFFCHQWATGTLGDRPFNIAINIGGGDLLVMFEKHEDQPAATFVVSARKVVKALAPFILKEVK